MNLTDALIDATFTFPSEDRQRSHPHADRRRAISLLAFAEELPRDKDVSSGPPESSGTSTMPATLSRNMIVVLSSLLHMSWGVALLFGPLHTTGIELILALALGNNIIAAIVLMAVAWSALVGLFCRNLLASVFLLLPQQFVLIASAIGAIFCMVEGRFADGAIYPRPFVFVDQIYLVLLACGHAQQMIVLWRDLER